MSNILHLVSAAGFKVAHLILESKLEVEEVHVTELCKWNSGKGVVPKQLSDILH